MRRPFSGRKSWFPIEIGIFYRARKQRNLNIALHLSFNSLSLEPTWLGEKHISPASPNTSIQFDCQFSLFLFLNGQLSVCQLLQLITGHSKWCKATTKCTVGLIHWFAHATDHLHRKMASGTDQPQLHHAINFKQVSVWQLKIVWKMLQKSWKYSCVCRKKSCQLVSETLTFLGSFCNELVRLSKAQRAKRRACWELAHQVSNPLERVCAGD